jgi:hypothetical protein
MSSPENVAAMIRGIRAAQPVIGAAAVEALLWIASGVDCAADLAVATGLDPGHTRKVVNLLCGRGTLGKAGRRSSLRLVERRKHPHRPGFQLALSQNGLDLISHTFSKSASLHQCKTSSN